MKLQTDLEAIVSSQGKYALKECVLAQGQFIFQVDIDFNEEAIGTGKNEKNVYLKDIWPSNEEVSKVEITQSLIKL